MTFEATDPVHSWGFIGQEILIDLSPNKAMFKCCTWDFCLEMSTVIGYLV